MTVAAIDFQMLANAGFPPAHFAAGDVVFSEGDKGDVMYVIRSGELDIVKSGKVMETLGPGGVFGEMALIDGSPRVATVTRQDRLRAGANQREELPLPRARDALFRRRRDAYARQPPPAHGRDGLGARLKGSLNPTNFLAFYLRQAPAMIGARPEPLTLFQHALVIARKFGAEAPEQR